MMYLVYLENLMFVFDNSENAVSFLEKAKVYYYGNSSKFIFTILTKEEFRELEKKISEEKEKIKILKEEGMII